MREALVIHPGRHSIFMRLINLVSKVIDPYYNNKGNADSEMERE